MHAVFQFIIIHKTASLECILQGAKMMDVKGCQIGTVGKMRTNKFKAQTSVGKIVDSVFCNSEGILSANFVKRSATINSEQRVQTLTKLK